METEITMYSNTYYIVNNFEKLDYLSTNAFANMIQQDKFHGINDNPCVGAK